MMFLTHDEMLALAYEITNPPKHPGGGENLRTYPNMASSYVSPR